MMKEQEKIKMHLNIGGERISLTVPFSNQDFVRDVETDVNTLYKSWRKTFTGLTNHEIMAMVAYRYASFYTELKQRYEDAARQAEICLESLERKSDSPDDGFPAAES